MTASNARHLHLVGEAPAAPLLAVEDLAVDFSERSGTVRAVDGVSLTLAGGETLGIVGESGCGKSVTALSILRLVPSPPGRIAEGRILFQGRDLLALPEREMQAVRGRDIAMVFQEPMTSLNPVLTIGHQITETLVRHQRLSRAAARQRAMELIELVGIAEPARRLAQYPHELSGGQRQRMMIAIALSCSPKILVADEPTTALDVTVQAQILGLIADLKRAFGMSVILITHDLGVVAETCQRVVVMYAGRKVEEATAHDLFRRPAHPYTQALMRAMPRLARRTRPAERPRRLAEIPGTVPSLAAMPEGCRFADRCSYAVAACRSASPPLRTIGAGHLVACGEAERAMAADAVAGAGA
ncbi:MAG TPA: ABC transporter ATP-binding protein [Hyphomicrobiales bacterium]|nr:ABC transporter ATP-binding protein [Hyphomicrobiales bacterium]